jgi:hypothetical protein
LGNPLANVSEGTVFVSLWQICNTVGRYRAPQPFLATFHRVAGILARGLPVNKERGQPFCNTSKETKSKGKFQQSTDYFKNNQRFIS